MGVGGVRVGVVERTSCPQTCGRDFKATLAVTDFTGAHQIRLELGQGGGGGGRVLCPHQHQPTGWPHCFTDLYPP